METIEKQREKAFKQWQLLTASHLDDLENVLSFVDIYRMNLLQKSLFQETLELNEVMKKIDGDGFHNIPIKDIQYQLKNVQRNIIFFFQEEDKISETLNLEYEVSHEKEHNDIIQLSKFILEELDKGKIKAALSFHHKAISLLLAHFNKSNLARYNVEERIDFLSMAHNWEELSLFFSFPHYKIEDLSIRNLLQKVCNYFNAIENDQKDVPSPWNDIGPQLLKINNASKLIFPDWDVKIEIVIQKLQLLFKQTDSFLYEKNQVSFSKKKGEIYVSLYKILKNWKINFDSNNTLCKKTATDALNIQELSLIIPADAQSLHYKEYQEILESILSFKHGTQRLDGQITKNFLTTLSENLRKVMPRSVSKLGLTEKYKFILNNIEECNEHLKITETSLPDNRLDILIILILEYWHLYAIEKKRGKE